MKKTLPLFLLAALSLNSCADIIPSDMDTTSSEEVDDTSSARLSSDYPVIYVSVFTHVEQANGKETPDFSKDEDAFWEQRSLTLEFARMLVSKGVAYDYQPDWNVLEATLKFDHGTDDTNGKNYVQYMEEDLGVDIDPHNHSGQSDYNYADVAYLIDALGATPTGVVGGFIAGPASESELEKYWQPIVGNIYDYTWTPTILWGGGTFNHQGDEEALWTSGVWKPQDAEHFSTPDDNAPLAVVGRYTSDWDGLDELLEKQAKGELEMGKIYTVSIDAHQKNLSEDFIQEFSDKIDSYQEYTDEGQVAWMTLSQVYETWVTLYDSVANQLQYESDESVKTNETCGDKVCQLLERKNNLCPADCL